MKKRNVKQEKLNFTAAIKMPVAYSMERSTRSLDISVWLLGVVFLWRQAEKWDNTCRGNGISGI